MLIWLVISPLLFATLMYYIKKYFSDIGYLILLVLLTLNFALIIPLFSQLRDQGIIVEKLGGWAAKVGIVLAVDHLSFFLLFIIQTLFFFSFVYSKEYIKEDLSEYFALFFLLQGGVVLIVVTNDIFNMFVGLEIVSLVSYALVAYQRDKWGIEAGFKYLIIGSIGSMLFLWGIALLYSTTGYLNLTVLKESFGQVNPIIQRGIFVLVFAGLAIKAAAFPFHSWLADAHSSAPAPISAVLSGVVIKIPVYCLIRISSFLVGPVFFEETSMHVLIGGIGFLTIIVGHLMAYRQKQLKRMLSYSSMAQVGYIIVGLSCLNRLGIQGALFHMLSHAILKSGLFFIAGYLISKYQYKKIEDLRGLSKKHPLLCHSFIVLAFGMIGLPPTVGFISKWLIIMGAMEAGFYLPAFGVILGGLLALLYYVRIIVLFFSPVEDSLSLKKPFVEDFMLRIPILVMVCFSVLFFSLSNSIFQLLENAVAILIDNSVYISVLLGGG